MIGLSDVSSIGYVVDTMVLAMFVDSGHADLLAALAAGNLFVSPAIIDPAVTNLATKRWLSRNDGDDG